MTSRRSRDRKWRSERREFIYLDEVSVTSLIAARDGAIADTVTEKLARSAESESKFAVSGPIKSASIGSETRHRVTDTSSREVVRKAVVQSTFRDLRTGGRSDSAPLVRDIRDVPKKLVGGLGSADDLTWWKRRKLQKAGVLASLEDLNRGDVIEIEMSLRPHRLFSIVSVIESFADMMEGRADLFGEAANQVGEVTAIAEVIDRLMVGLVPIQGSAANLVVAQLDGRPYLIDARILAPGGELAAAAKPFELVALTEIGSYWKDLRRVLFSQNRYTIYARVASPELQDEWNPVKLADVTSDVSSELADSIRELPAILDDAMKEGDASPPPDVHTIMRRFARAISEEFETHPDEAVVEEVVASAVAAFGNAGEDLAAKRGAYDLIVRRYEGANDLKLDRNVVARTRMAIELEVSAKAAIMQARAIALPEEPTRKLEVEVVAIYW